MSRSPILFRCDGTPEAGWEPFYQCMTLAQAMQRRRRGTYLHSRLEPANLALTITRGGHEWLPAEHPVGTTDDLDETVRQARKIGAAAVVVVAPKVSVEYLRELTASGLLVVSLDNEGKLDFPNRLVFNPFIGVPAEDYKHARGTQLLAGPKYALIRGLIRRIRPLRAQEPPAPFRGFVAMGDNDLEGRSVKLAAELLDNPKVDKVAVAARPHDPHIEKLRELALSEPGRLEIVSENNEVTTRLGRSHFALTSGDSWSVEMACLGMPQLILSMEQRYASNAQSLEDEGTATYLGPVAKVTNGALRTAVSELLVDQTERRGMSRCGRQLIDGRGTDRFVTAVEVLLHVAANAGERRLAA
jgi:spore coat polysaccharide biosynthesis predicted glycosyltransferase SpsG